MTTETITNPQFEQDGKLHPDSAAAAAIKALPPGTLADQLVALEEAYEQFLYTRGKRTLRSRLAWWIGGKAMRVTRQEVALLAQEIQPLLLEDKRKGVAYSFGAEYHRMAEEMRGLRQFFLKYFEQDIHMAEGLNKPLLILAQEIMLRGR